MRGVLKSTFVVAVLVVMLVSCGGSGSNSGSVPDTNPPTVSATPASTGVNETTSVFSVELSCSDNDGSGCKAIYFTNNGDEPMLTSSIYSSD